MTMLPARGSNAWMGWAVGACLTMAMLALAERPLFNPDEGRYAEIPREMLAGGDWVIPHLNGLAYIEKPPLQYWITALIFAVLGESAFSARLFTFISALGTLLAVGWAARAIGTLDSALRAVFVLTGMFLFVVLGQLVTLDMALSFFLTCSLAGFLVAQVYAERGLAAQSRRAMLIAWVAAALGMLTKGLVAAVIPAATLGLYSIFSRDFSPWRRLHAGIGLIVFIALVLPWHWLAQSRLADFLQFFFVHEHFQRFATASANRQQPWWFFGAVLAGGALPWTLSVLRVLSGGWRRRVLSPRFDAELFLWIWAVFILVFFSLSDSKLVPYVLPAFPALALLVGVLPERAVLIDVRRAAMVMLSMGVLLATGAAVLPLVLKDPARAPYFLSIRTEIWIAVVLLLAAAAGALRFVRSDLRAGVMSVGLGSCLALLVLIHCTRALAPVYSGLALLEPLKKAGADTPIYSVGTYDQTVPFYLGRTVTLVHYRGELDYGLRHDPGRAIAEIGDFLVRWRDQPNALAIMEPATFDALKAQHLPMQELDRDVHRLVVGHP